MADIHVDGCKEVNGKLQVGLLFHFLVGEPAIEEAHSQTIILFKNDSIDAGIKQKIKNMFLAKKAKRTEEYTQEHKFDGVEIQDATA